MRKPSISSSVIRERWGSSRAVDTAIASIVRQESANGTACRT
jgi:hypothetical protein